MRAPRFTGKDPEPRPGLSSGHMPHAHSLPFSSFLQSHAHPVPTRGSYSTFLPPVEIQAILEKTLGEAGARDALEGKRGVIASCGSGMTAGVLWLGLRMLGVSSPAIYDEVGFLSIFFFEFAFSVLVFVGADVGRWALGGSGGATLILIVIVIGHKSWMDY